ncbi:MAG: peptidyl-tRNA hydrolase Pth2 [Nitrososphaeria archaeon]
MSQEYKQAIVVRSDLKMHKGKIAAQVAHASLIGAEETRKRKPEIFKRWWEGGQKKVVLKVGGLEEILQLAEVAERNCVVNAIIEDKGLTQIPPGTITCISIGPDEEEKIQEITGKLKLL